MDIGNEARMISVLCSLGKSKYVVEIASYCWLPRNSFYYIDMEYCKESLHDRIQGMPGELG